jgi:histidine ammonia-lyase
LNQFFSITPKGLSLSDIRNIISNRLRLSLSSESVERINTNRRYLEEKLKNNDQAYYGINTGFGSLCDQKISNEELKKLQINLVISHACGVGKEIELPIVKLMLLLKINALSFGFSGIRLQTVEKLIFFFNNDILPVVFESGSLGASGDLAPLAHLSLPLIGEGMVYYQNKKVKSSELLRNLNQEIIELDSKEGLALLNGTQFMAAHATHSYLKLESLFEWSNKIAALSLDAFNCRLSPFDPKPHQLRLYPGQKYCASKISKFLMDSDLVGVKEKSVQDPYSFRCIPQVHGASFDVLNDFSSKLSIEINSVTDNPIVFDDEDEIISAGNFHGQPIALAMDFMAIAAAELGSISERRIYKLISGTRGLPPFLIENPGLNSGFMIAQYTAASLVSKNKILCHPASVDSIESSNGQEDHVSMGSIAGVKLVEVIKNIHSVLSIELLTSAQAMNFRRPRKSSPELERLLRDFRNKIPYIKEDVIMHDLIIKSEKFLLENI